METVTVQILRHIESGLFLSVDPANMPHTKKIRKARRFYSSEELANFLDGSFYRPDKPEEYEIVDLEIEYRLKEETT